MKSYLQENMPVVINASGRMTKLGVSTQSPYVRAAMSYASQNYFVINDLYQEAGHAIARLLGTEDAVVVSSASSGIVLSIAGLICGKSHARVQNLPIVKEQIRKKKVILPKGHDVNYGAPMFTMIASGGGQVVEAGCANQCTAEDVESLIDDDTLCLMYVKSHHSVQTEQVSIEELVEIKNRHQLPLLIDAAAEEDFKKYYEMGADLVVYSGSKALCGPSSGFVLCRDQAVAQAIRLHYYGIGRSMKIGKENIFGLVAALEEYVDHPVVHPVGHKEIARFVSWFNQVEGIQASVIQDEAGRAIYRAKLQIIPKVFGMDAVHLNQELNAGNPSIYVRDNEVKSGILYIDPRPLTSPDQLQVIFERLKEIGEDYD